MGAASGQERLNDKDLGRLLKNVAEDAKSFSGHFKKAVEKSSIRKTSKEKDAKKLAERFAEQTKKVAEKFDDKQKTDEMMPAAFQSLNQLGEIMRDLGISGEASVQFEKVKSEMTRVAHQFGVTPPAS